MVGVGCLGWLQPFAFVPSLIKRLAGLVVAAAAADVLAGAGFANSLRQPFGGGTKIAEYVEMSIVGDCYCRLAATSRIVYGWMPESMSFLEVLPAFFGVALSSFAHGFIPCFPFVGWHVSRQESSCDLVSCGSYLR